MFPNRLKTLRNEHSWTQADLAQRINVSPKTIGTWERGTREPPIETITKLSDIFEVSSDYLLGKTDKKHYYDLTNKDKNGIDKQIEDMMSGVSDNSLAYFQNGAELDDDDKKLLEASLRQVLETSRVLAKKKFTPKKYRDTDDE